MGADFAAFPMPGLPAVAVDAEAPQANSFLSLLQQSTLLQQGLLLPEGSVPEQSSPVPQYSLLPASDDASPILPAAVQLDLTPADRVLKNSKAPVTLLMSPGDRACAARGTFAAAS